MHHPANGSKVLLLARATRTTDWGGSSAYVSLRLADYLSHVGERHGPALWRSRSARATAPWHESTAERPALH